MAENKDSSDGDLRGGERPEAPRKESPPFWATPLAAALVLGLFTVLNAWFVYLASSAKDASEAHYESLATELNDMKARMDRMDDRIIFLEQNRRAATPRKEPDVASVNHQEPT